jgi:hypothetical protein
MRGNTVSTDDCKELAMKGRGRGRMQEPDKNTGSGKGFIFF